MLNIKSTLLTNVACLLLGVLLTLAFAPWQIASLAILSPVVLILLWLACTKSHQAFLRGWLFGLGFFGTSVWWVTISLHDFGQLPLPLAILVTALFCALLACFPALVGWVSIRFFRASLKLQCLLIIPSVWTLTEWLRGHLFTGFPWVLLGYSQTDSWLNGFAPMVGSYGLSFICMLLASLTVLLIKKRRWIYALGIATIFSTGYALSYVQWTTPTQTPITVSLIQGNIAQNLKWDRAAFYQTIDKYNHLVKSELGRDIIILPESAIPAPEWSVHDYLSSLDKLARDANSSLIVGVPVQTQAMRQNDTYYNAILVSGTDKGEYYKRHLVPFGEYLDFLRPVQFILDYFQIPMASFIPGPADIQPLIVKNIAIEPLICYEIAYSHLVYANLPKASLIVLVNDDSWFGDSNAAIQHLQIARMRAIETGRYVIFESNTGITAIINPFGKILNQLPINKTGVLRDHVDGMQGSPPITRWGDRAVILLCLLLLLLGWLLQYRLTSRK